MSEKIVIQEQVIKDLATGLTIEIKARQDGESRLCLYGDSLPFSNREFHFDKCGRYVGTGTWLKQK